MNRNLQKELDEAGFGALIFEDKLLMSNTDGTLGWYGMLGWQWELFRSILLKAGLDYYIVELKKDIFSIQLITLEDSLNY